MRWHTLSSPAAAAREPAPVRPRRVLVQLALGVAAVLLVVGLLGSWAARGLAEREAVNDSADMTDILAESVIQPAMTQPLYEGDPAAVRAFDALVRRRVMTQDVVRVKLWRSDGRILYADEPQLIGRTFALSEDELTALQARATHAEISDLRASENAFETGDRLVEVYRPVWFPNRTTALFEVYTSYAPVGARSAQLWRGMTALTAGSLLLLVLLIAPIVWHLARRVRSAESQRADLLERAVAASDDERRRIAASLHDGPVQELVATSLAITGAAGVASRSGQETLGSHLDGAARMVRQSIRSLRTLLVDIYPQSLESAGIVATLGDLAQTVASESVRVHTCFQPEATLRLGRSSSRLVFRVAQETLRNAAAHADPALIELTLRRQEARSSWRSSTTARVSMCRLPFPSPRTATSGCGCWPTTLPVPAPAWTPRPRWRPEPAGG